MSPLVKTSAQAESRPFRGGKFVGTVDLTSPASRRVLVVLTRPLAAVICCGLLALMGCSDESSSSADPPPATTTAASSSPESTPSQDSETPEEFVRRWVETDREMQNSGDTEAVRSVSEGCTPCDGLADQVDDIYAKGGHVKTDGLKILRLKASKQDRNDEVAVHIWVDSRPTELVESAGAEVQRLPGGRLQYIVTIRETGSGWN